MTATVADASTLVALLVDDGPDGTWASEACGSDALAAPQLAAFETANILRRMALANDITEDQATLAHADLGDLHIDYWSYDILAARAWELRHNLTVYDASYVALAEILDVALVTLDRRISRAEGPRCTISVPS